MEVGLAKLEEASVSVGLLKKDLAVMEEELADASQKAEMVRTPSPIISYLCEFFFKKS